MGLLIFGVILIAVGVFLLFGYFSRKRKVEVMESTQTSTVEFLKSLAASMTEGVGQGTLSYMTEIKGKIVCDQPLTSELTGSPCVYYSMKIQRQYEETYYTTDNQGRRTRQTRTEYEPVASNHRWTPFYIHDGTGQIKVDPSSAEFVTEKVLSRFDPASGYSGGMIQFGSFSIQIPMSMNVGDRRTIGYSFEEEAILTGRELYILGEVTDRGGELCIQRPKDPKGKFIVSVKSEEELLRNIHSEMMWMIIGSILCGLGGIGLIIANVLKIRF